MAITTLQSRLTNMNPRQGQSAIGEFFENFATGAQPGLVGGAITQAATDIYGGLRGTPIATPTQPILGKQGQLPANLPNILGQSGAQTPTIQKLLGGKMPTVQVPGVLDRLGQTFGQVGQLNQFLGSIQRSRTERIEQATGPGPEAQPSPILGYAGGSTGPGRGYFSFEKYFSSPVDSRPVIEMGRAVGTPAKSDQTEEGQSVEAEFGRPESGLKGYLYDIGKFLRESEGAQTVAGMIGSLAGGALAGYFTGGIGASAGALAGSAALGGLTKGIGGTLERFFAERRQPKNALQVQQQPRIV